MALQKQLVALPIDSGLDTKLDSKQEQIGFLRKAQNCVYETLLKLRKRNGYDALNTRMLGTTTDIDSFVDLAKYKTELLAMTESALYSYSPTLERWTSKGAVYPVKTGLSGVYKNAGSQSEVNGITVENLQISVYEDSSGGSRYSVQDLNSGSFLVSGAQISATAKRPRVGHTGNTVFLVYAETVNVKFKSFSLNNPGNLSAATTVDSNLHATEDFMAVDSYGQKVFVAYNSSDNTAELKIFAINADSTTSSILSINGHNAVNCLDVTCDSIGRVLMTWSDNVDLNYAIFPYTLSTSLLAATSLETLADVINATVVDNGTNYSFYYEVDAAGETDNKIRHVTATVAGAVASPSNFKLGMGLGAKAFMLNGQPAIVGLYRSNLQSTYFVLDSSGNVVTKFANQEGAESITWGALSPVNEVSDNVFSIIVPTRNRILGGNGTFFSSLGVSSVELDFDGETPFQRVEIADSLLLASGVLKMYDGAQVVEHGFHYFPENLSSPSNSVSGGSMSNGTYTYTAVYRWTDNTGKDHISAPSPDELEVTLSNGGSSQSAVIRVPTLRLTEKTNVAIDIYRTEDAGTTFYKVTNDLSPTLNVTTANYIDFTDTVSDADLINNELLYTTGGELENIAAPAANLLAIYNNRVVVVGEQSNRVYFGKSLVEGKPAEFTDGIYRDVDEVGGPLSALIQMTDKLIIFSNDASFFVAGDGPTNTGQQDTLTLPERIAIDLGCTDPSSLSLTPTGLMFKSRKGIWRMNAGFAVEYKGDRVEEFNSASITSARIVGQLNQVRFLTNGTTALVYNYNLDRWATFENHGGLASEVIGNDYYYLREDGQVWKENRDSFADVSTPIKMRIETGWMSFAELQGFQRVYQAYILGNFKSNHKLRVRVAYDFKDAWLQDELIDPLNFINNQTYGEESPYGNSSTYGSGNLYQMRVDMARQKCTAIKFLIEDIQSEPGEGFDLSKLTLRVGIKEGGNKLPSTNKF